MVNDQDYGYSRQSAEPRAYEKPRFDAPYEDPYQPTLIPSTRSRYSPREPEYYEPRPAPVSRTPSRYAEEEPYYPPPPVETTMSRSSSSGVAYNRQPTVPLEEPVDRVIQRKRPAVAVDPNEARNKRVKETIDALPDSSFDPTIDLTADNVATVFDNLISRGLASTINSKIQVALLKNISIPYATCLRIAEYSTLSRIPFLVNSIVDYMSNVFPKKLDAGMIEIFMKHYAAISELDRLKSIAAFKKKNGVVLTAAQHANIWRCCSASKSQPLVKILAEEIKVDNVLKLSSDDVHLILTDMAEVHCFSDANSFFATLAATSGKTKGDVISSRTVYDLFNAGVEVSNVDFAITILRFAKSRPCFLSPDSVYKLWLIVARNIFDKRNISDDVIFFSFIFYLLIKTRFVIMFWRICRK